MESQTIRISREAHETLRWLAKEDDELMIVVVDKVVEAYGRQRFLDGLNADFAALQKDPSGWAEAKEERQA